MTIDREGQQASGESDQPQSLTVGDSLSPTILLASACILAGYFAYISGHAHIDHPMLAHTVTIFGPLFVILGLLMLLLVDVERRRINRNTSMVERTLFISAIVSIIWLAPRFFFSPYARLIFVIPVGLSVGVYLGLNWGSQSGA